MDCATHPDADEDGEKDARCWTESCDNCGDCDDSDPSVHPGAPDDWETEILYTGTDADQGVAADTGSDWYGWDLHRAPAIAVGAAGVVHVVVGLDQQLLHFTNGSGAWAHDSIDDVSTLVANWPSLAIDPLSDEVHVVYGDQASGVMLATLADGSWTKAFVTADATRAALASGPDGALHLAFARDEDIVHLSNATGDWNESIVPTLVGENYHSLDPTGAVELVIDDAGAAHVLFEERYDGGRVPSLTVGLATDQSGAWVASMVGEGENVQMGIGSAVGGGAHVVASVELGTGRAKDLIYRGPASARIPGILCPGCSTRPSVVEADGRIQIACRSAVYSASVEGTDTWTVDEFAPRTINAIAAAADADGNLHLVYLLQHDSTIELRYARRGPPDGIDQDCDGADG